MPTSRSIPGGGAAGGLGGALAALGGTLMPGFELVADELDLYDHLEDADLVITGEGLPRRHQLRRQGRRRHRVDRRGAGGAACWRSSGSDTPHRSIDPAGIDVVSLVDRVRRGRRVRGTEADHRASRGRLAALADDSSCSLDCAEHPRRVSRWCRRSCRRTPGSRGHRADRRRQLLEGHVGLVGSEQHEHAGTVERPALDRRRCRHASRRRARP